MLKDFAISYSPERINPSDKLQTFENNLKIFASNGMHNLGIVTKECQEVAKAKVLRVSTVRKEEALNVVENDQRDISIALVNELANTFYLCNRYIGNIKFQKVLLPL